MSDKEQPLNGQQMAQAQKLASEMVAKALNDVELRKLALRHACDMEQGKGSGNVVKMAEGMHAFLTAGVRDIANPNQV